MKLLPYVMLVTSTIAVADPVPAAVRAHAKRREGSLSIDGRLDESAWANAPKQGNFTQRFPKEGAKADLDTRFAVLYDDAAIYVGVWADDPHPERIKRLLTRRDVDGPADAVAIAFDSYHDRRTAYVFQLNAAGVQRDMLFFDDSKQDDTWDAVWTGDVATTPVGWTAEFRIPLNQLRFPGGETQEWGLQLTRVVGHTSEQSSWSPWPRSAPEIVSRFGTVDGIDRIKPSRRLELLPYASGGFDVMPVEAADPLNDSKNLRGNIGLDVRYGLGPAFTLSATINPDFGQVEADPSQVNLGGNELFFAEKRPFFLEGVDLFKLPIGQSDGSIEGSFYSRRIGAAPREPDMDYDYIRAPKSTTIYTAMKLTGKTRGGWSVGVFDAVTGEENATIVDGAGVQSSPIVAPLTNYGMARVKRDFNDGRTSIGGSATAVNRALDGTPLESSLHDQAYTAGFQVQHRFGTTPYQIDIHGVGSYVHGSEEAIAATQRSFRHLYQRPDIEGDRYDPTRRSLTGGDVSWKVGKIGDTKHWRWGSGGDIRTRGLELNDMGFQNASDHTIPYLFVQYTDNDPGDHVLNWGAYSDLYLVSTLEPTLGDFGYEGNINAQLVNYWNLGAGINLDYTIWDWQALRGGESLHGDTRRQGFVNINTDTRKRVWFSFSANAGRTEAQDEIDGGVDVSATVQARSNVDISLAAGFSDRVDTMQYVDQVDDTLGQSHFVFGKIRQTVAAMTLRLNWTFSPRLSLQVYAQPFVASGSYTELKDVDNPRAKKFLDRYTPIENPTLADGTYMVTAPTGATYEVGRPDFNFRQFNSTLVLRWEYRPGSSIFAIWSHGRTDQIDDGRFRLGHDLGGLADAEGQNVVMVKANYWIGL